ncbi:major facilitator superfamily MFS_1 (plasmid) [Scytonema sp. HK-05]|uniref:MFS transporter n=1 Tax=Scytonema sp. HK-05 TaxID=1137095 RepID=UPI000937606D|nr:MFS transporter [Scytonema sp. HK-05]OKH59461.1 MFS transporter [Scytonema sp. HK-05]BAY50147.1 major facilitator superfamily MFS_1 [Scytonema sp. HK-05]
MQTFIIIWIGQLVSLLGSGVTNFALSIWVYENTKSATQFALMSVLTLVPAMIFSPVAGSLGDRRNRRKIIVLSNCGAGLSILAIAVLLYIGHLEIWHIYVATAASSAFNALQWPAYNAVIPLLVPPQHLVRANGMFQVALAVSQLISPVLGGFLLATIQIKGVFILNGISFVFCVVMFLLVRLPKPGTKSGTTTKAKMSKRSILWNDTLEGWNYITSRRGLFWLSILFCVYHFVEGTTIVLSTPLFLSFTSTSVLGIMLSIGGTGMLLGTAFISTWGGGKRRIYNVLGFMVLGGLCMLLAGLRPDVVLCTVAIFLHFFSLPIIISSKQAIMQSKVALNLQARVFAVNGMLINFSLLLAYLVAGPLADLVFEPLLTVNGPLAGSVGKIIGVGPGRGIGLFFIIMGIFLIVATVTSYLSPRLRLVESELPNVISQ